MPPIFWTQKQDIGPSRRTRHGLVYDAARDRVVLFGGDPGGAPLADTWHWDGTLWTQVADTGPSARHSVAMAYDSAAQRVVLFGGASGSTFFGDTWEWDGTEWTQVADTGPLARASLAMAHDGVRGRTVLFGGAAAGALTGDTWEWDATEWTQVQDVGPSARRGHAMTFDATASRVLLFGGAGADGAGLNDTWGWDGTAWTQVADTGPDPRAASALVGNGVVVLFGGVNSINPGLPPVSRVMYGDSWRWEGNAWTKIQDIGPAPRWGHGMAYRSAAGRIVLFGGSTLFAPAQDASLVPGLQPDTWEVQPGPGAAGGPGAEVAAVAIVPDLVADEGEVLEVTVTLTGPAPGPVDLVTGIFADDGSGNYVPISPPGFAIPAPITIGSGETSTQFQIVRDADPLAAGNYAIGVAVEGGSDIGGAFFTVV